MQEEKFISVVLCNFNYGHLISDAIESVLTQKYSAWELIVVDDGSTDDSRQVIARYAGAYPGKIQSIYKSNEGQGQGFNDGIDIARGEIICFLDSDDIWMPDKLAMVNSWFSERNDIALLQHNLKIMHGDKPTEANFRSQLSCGNILEETKRTGRLPQFVPTSGLAIHRKVVKKVLPIPKEFRTCADGYLTRTSMCYGTVYSDPQTYGYYRRHGDNCVLGNNADSVRHYVHVLLIPQLNAYYNKRGIDLELPTPRYRLDTLRHIKRIRSLKPWELLRCSPAYETVRSKLAEKGILIDSVNRYLGSLRGAYAGKECHVLGRCMDFEGFNWRSLGEEFVFVADVNAMVSEVSQLSQGMYCISDLRFWELSWRVSQNMKEFLGSISSLTKFFELPARPRKKELPDYSLESYIFKTVNRDFPIWKGNVTLDVTRRLMWGYHVVLDMCLPMAFHLGFSKVHLHGCEWDISKESMRLRDFFTLFGCNNDYNLSESILPFYTAHGRTDVLWENSFRLLVSEYGRRGMVVNNY